MKKSFFSILFVAFALSIFAQTQKFEIILFNKVIGTGTITKTVEKSNNSIKYKLITDAKAKVMLKEKTSYVSMDFIMKDGVLTSLSQTKIDDGEKQLIKVVTEGGTQYHYLDGKKTKVTKPITYTSTHLLSNEPVGIKEVYIERFNIFVPIEKVDANTYKTKVDGTNNFYEYRNGKLYEYRTKNIVNVYMRPI